MDRAAIRGCNDIIFKLNMRTTLSSSRTRRSCQKLKDHELNRDRITGHVPSPTLLARFRTEPARAKDLADLLAEQLGSATAVAAYEDGGLWCVEVQFADSVDPHAARNALQPVVGTEAMRDLRFETVTARDWVATSLAGLQPVEAGGFIVHGAHDRARIPVNRIAIEIEAALAFGTGHHGTTRACLLALDRLAKTQAKKRRLGRARRPGTSSRVAALDVGTGTGVLAIAAAKRLHGRVLASDIDPAAVRIAAENATRNGVSMRVTNVRADGLAAGPIRRAAPYPLVFANILLAPLQKLAGPLARLTAPGAQVVLSGLLARQANAAVATYRSHGLRLDRRIILDGWATLVLRRHGDRRSRPRRETQVTRRR